MRKKQSLRVTTRRNVVKETTSSCSEEEKMKSLAHTTRRKKSSSVASASSTSLRRSSRGVDSAYEADDSSRSESSPPKQPMVDEYEIDSIEDIPVVATKKTRKRKTVPQSQEKPQILMKTVTKKKRTNLNVSSSTPVQEGGRNGKEFILTTPEVTPILPDLSDLQSQFVVTDHISTPTLRMPRRKRSFSFQDPELSSISGKISFNSTGDSGIGISPPLKKSKSSTATNVKDSSSDSKLVLAGNTILPPLSSSSSTTHSSATGSSKVFHCYSVKGKQVFKESSFNSSCFGFDSIQTPSPIRRSRKPRKVGKKVAAVKVTKVSKTDYRSPRNDTDSVFEDSPAGRGVYSSSVSSDSPNNLVSPSQQTSSPSLFSDEMISESETVDKDKPVFNRTVNKSYKGVKAKIKKSESKVSKLDAWASSFNTELENIEKLDLNVE